MKNTISNLGDASQYQVIDRSIYLKAPQAKLPHCNQKNVTSKPCSLTYCLNENLLKGKKNPNIKVSESLEEIKMNIL